MRMFVYAIYDRKTDAYGSGNLMQYPNDDIAKRAIHAAVLDASMEYSRYAADFSLWRVGEFDTESGFMLGYAPSDRSKVCEFDEFLTSRAYVVPVEAKEA